MTSGVGAGVLLSACGETDGTQTEGTAPDELPPLADLGKDVPPACAPYANDPDVFGYCIQKIAGGAPSREALEALCAQAGDWEPECRHSWVAGQMKDPSVPLEMLLEVCDGNPDCAFELIDMRVDDDVLVQIQRCSEHVRGHLDDCVGHAMQRWYLAKPDAEEYTRVASTPMASPDKVGHFLGASVTCRGIGTCEEAATTPMAERCKHSADHLERNPGSCPQDQKQPLFHNQGGQAPAGMGPNPGGQNAGQPGQRPQGSGGPGNRRQGLPPGTPPPRQGGG